MAAQSLQNHTRLDPKYHFVLAPLALACLITAIVRLVHAVNSLNVLLVAMALAVQLVAAVTRLYALQNQDRIIRLEEQVRLRRLGFDAQGLSTKQMVALRFAADEEVAALAARARVEQLDPKQIKAAIRTWRADTERI